MSVNRYSPLVTSSYIKLPTSIQNKKVTINIQNQDNKCFAYCLSRALNPNPEKTNLVSKHLKEVCVNLGLDKLKMPVSLKDIPRIKENFNLDINIFGHYGRDIFPLGHIKDWQENGKFTIHIRRKN